MRWYRLLTSGVLWVVLQISPAFAMEQLVIATSPSMRIPLEALGRQFEKTHPNIKVRLYFDSGLDLRRTIAGMENNPRGQYFIGSGPLHLVAPGGDLRRDGAAALRQRHASLDRGPLGRPRDLRRGAEYRR